MLRYMLAMELQAEGANERAFELFHGLMNDSAPHVPSFLIAGQLLASLGRTEEARTVYQTGIHHAQVQENDHAAGEMAQFLQELD